MLTTLLNKTDKKSETKNSKIPFNDFYQFNERDLATVLGGGEEVTSFSPALENTILPYESHFKAAEKKG